MKRLLVVVDYQNDFVTGALGFEKAKTLEKGIVAKVERYLNNGDFVLFTKDTHNDSYLNTLEGVYLPTPHCIEGTEGYNLFGDLSKYDNHKVKNVFYVNKESFGVSPLDIEEFACGLGTDRFNLLSIELVGVVTNMCVISNVVAFKSYWIDTPIVVDASLCASFNDDLHEKALDVIAGLQVDVINRKRKEYLEGSSIIRTISTTELISNRAKDIIDFSSEGDLRQIVDFCFKKDCVESGKTITHAMYEVDLGTKTILADCRLYVETCKEWGDNRIVPILSEIKFEEIYKPC